MAPTNGQRSVNAVMPRLLRRDTAGAEAAQEEEEDDTGADAAAGAGDAATWLRSRVQRYLMCAARPHIVGAAV